VIKEERREREGTWEVPTTTRNAQPKMLKPETQRNMFKKHIGVENARRGSRGGWEEISELSSMIRLK